MLIWIIEESGVQTGCTETEEMYKSKPRQHNMDIERIILALFVIVAHFNHRDMGGALN